MEVPQHVSEEDIRNFPFTKLEIEESKEKNQFRIDDYDSSAEMFRGFDGLKLPNDKRFGHYVALSLFEPFGVKNYNRLQRISV